MRVLLIDDDRIQLKMVRAWLEPMGFAVHASDSVIEGLEALAVHEDVVLAIVDWHMQPYSGPAFVAAVRQEERFTALPILMLTAEDDAAAVQLALRLGVDAYLLKPLRHRLLIERMAAFDLVVMRDGSPNRHPRFGVPTDMVPRPQGRANADREPTRRFEPEADRR